MAFSSLMQLGLNLFLLAGFAIIWMRVRRNQGDDPRMSRSLQLLQSKISILEDLSDRIDEQLTQATGLMEHKKKELDAKIAEVDRTLHEIQVSRDKSLQVAQIFEDKIPHEEIMERQRTRQYVKAAQLAHQGLSVSEIVEQVNLPFAEVDLIAKMNREQLQFSAEDLPDWAQAELTGGSLAITAVSDDSNSLTIEFPNQPSKGVPVSVAIQQLTQVTAASTPAALTPAAPAPQATQQAVTERLNLSFSNDPKVNASFASSDVITSAQAAEALRTSEDAAAAVQAFFANEAADVAQAAELARVSAAIQAATNQVASDSFGSVQTPDFETTSIIAENDYETEAHHGADYGTAPEIKETPAFPVLSSVEISESPRLFAGSIENSDFTPDQIEESSTVVTVADHASAIMREVQAARAAVVVSSPNLLKPAVAPAVSAQDNVVASKPVTVTPTSAAAPVVQQVTSEAGQARMAKAKLSAKDLQRAITSNGKPVVVQKIVFPKLSMNRNLN